MSKKKSGKHHTNSTNDIVMITAILNLIRTIADLVKTIIEIFTE